MSKRDVNLNLNEGKARSIVKGRVGKAAKWSNDKFGQTSI